MPDPNNPDTASLGKSATALRIAHFSAGASSAAAAIIGRADRCVYAETGSEHPDNERFIADFEAHTGMTVARFRSEKFKDTWDVWEKERYLAGIYGAPCSRALKIKPLAAVERIPGAVHLFGYTANEVHRRDRLMRHKPDLRIECPLIDAGIDSAGARGFLEGIGLKPPITYEMGLPHANCIPCPKSGSPGYWALIREKFPKQFERMAALEQAIRKQRPSAATFGLLMLKGERVSLRDLPTDTKPSGAEAAGCDLLCEIARSQYGGKAA